MAFTLWLSADEERILERIMAAEGTYSKQQAVISAIREKGAQLGAGHADLAGAVETSSEVSTRSVTEQL